MILKSLYFCELKKNKSLLKLLFKGEIKIGVIFDLFLSEFCGYEISLSKNMQNLFEEQAVEESFSNILWNTEREFL